MAFYRWMVVVLLFAILLTQADCNLDEGTPMVVPYSEDHRHMQAHCQSLADSYDEYTVCIQTDANH